MNNYTFLRLAYTLIAISASNYLVQWMFGGGQNGYDFGSLLMFCTVAYFAGRHDANKEKRTKTVNEP